MKKPEEKEPAARKRSAGMTIRLALLTLVMLLIEVFAGDAAVAAMSPESPQNDE